MDANRYRVVSIILLIVYCYFAVPIAAGLTAFAGAMIGQVLSGGWAIAATILIGLTLADVAIHFFTEIRRRRADGYYTRVFHGYAGERFPVFHLLELAGTRSGGAFTRKDVVYSIGVGADELFVLRNGRSKELTRLVGGTVVERPGSGDPLTFRRSAITGVSVVERSDEEIAAGAVDTRDFGDRLASQIAQKLTGTSVKTRIVPFAAYLMITHQTAEGEELLLAAVPTEVGSDLLAKLGHAIDANQDQADAAGAWIGDKVGEGAKTLAGEMADAGGTAVVGSGAVDAAHSAMGAVGEAMSWLNPDQASIGATAGDRGRAAAHLIAARLRQLAGLPAAA